LRLREDDLRVSSLDSLGKSTSMLWSSSSSHMVASSSSDESSGSLPASSLENDLSHGGLGLRMCVLSIQVGESGNVCVARGPRGARPSWRAALVAPLCSCMPALTILATVTA